MAKAGICDKCGNKERFTGEFVDPYTSKKTTETFRLCEDCLREFDIEMEVQSFHAEVMVNNNMREPKLPSFEMVIE